MSLVSSRMDRSSLQAQVETHTRPPITRLRIEFPEVFEVEIIDLHSNLIAHCKSARIPGWLPKELAMHFCALSVAKISALRVACI